MNKRFTLAVAALLVAALLTACGGTAASSAAASVPSSVAAVATPEPTVQPSPEAELPPVEEGSLEEAANGVIGFEMDSAGGSLKTALAACGLLDWCAANPDYDEASLTGSLAEWYASLDDLGREMFGLNIAGVIAQADEIIADPAGQAGLLESAGVETDYSNYDANFSGLRNALVAMIQTEDVDVSAQSDVVAAAESKAAEAEAVVPESSIAPDAVDADKVLGVK